jgi:hypothetical protein
MGTTHSRVGPYYVPPWFFRISPISGIKAEVIFDDADVIFFETWQEKKKHNHDRIGYIFNGFEYDAFIQWRDGALSFASPKKTSAFWQLRAPSCGHMLHPVNKNSFRCPQCEIEICLEFQELLISSMDRAQKQAIDAEYLEDLEAAKERIRAARRGWRRARLILIHAITYHENLAELEVKWLQSDDATAWPKKIFQGYINTSASAVEYAYANTKYQAVITNAQPGNLLSLIKPYLMVTGNDIQNYEGPEDIDKTELDTELETLSKEAKLSENRESSGITAFMMEDSAPSTVGKTKKRVTFTADVVENLASREPKMFQRRGSLYVPGTYAPRRSVSYVDTSGYKSDSATIRQLKIYVETFDPDLANSTTSEEGIVGLHPLWPQIRDFMKAEEDGLMDDETDGLVVYRNHKGEVLGYEFAPLQESEDEDEDEDEDSLHRWQMAWTSLTQL